MSLKQNIRRAIRPAAKTVQAVARWKRLFFDDVPPIFGNSKPKSGSHLMLQVLAGICQVAPYKYVEREPIRTITKEGRRKTQEEILEDLRRVPKGVIGWGYLEATPENVAFLCRPERVNYFVYRDPRDLLVSQVFFATDMYEDHGMHDFYQSLPDFGERLKVAITGINRDGLYMVDVRQRYEGVFKWLEQNQAMSIRFEDLINNRDATLSAMLDEIEKTGYRIPTPREKALSILVKAIQPMKSRTFRSGKTGSWKQFFSEEHKKLFKDAAGDLVVRLGYEKSNDW